MRQYTKLVLSFRFVNSRRYQRVTRHSAVSVFFQRLIDQGDFKKFGLNLNTSIFF